jgi:hypothetical protein
MKRRTNPSKKRPVPKGARPRIKHPKREGNRMRKAIRNLVG